MAMTASQAQMANDLEIEMMQDLYMKKCVPPKYKDSELSKGESICLDRCVAKYFEVFDRIGKKLTSITQQQAQAAGQASQENVLKL